MLDTGRNVEVHRNGFLDRESSWGSHVPSFECVNSVVVNGNHIAVAHLFDPSRLLTVYFEKAFLGVIIIKLKRTVKGKGITWALNAAFTLTASYSNNAFSHSTTAVYKAKCCFGVILASPQCIQRTIKTIEFFWTWNIYLSAVKLY